LVGSFVWRLWRVERFLSGVQVLVVAVGILGTVGIAFWLFGYFGLGPVRASGGFEMFTADLLSLVDPATKSRLLPSLPSSGQREGLGWLGLGGAALAFAALVRVAVDRRVSLPAFARPAAWVCGAMMFYSLGSVVTVAGFQLWSAQKLWSFVPVIPEAFRAPGRFIWPMHYAVLAGALLTVRRWFSANGNGFALVCVLACAATALDAPGRPFFGAPPGAALEQAETWSALAQGKKHLVLFPPRIVDGTSRGCDEETFDNGQMSLLLYRAYRLGLTFNSGYVARVDQAKARAVCSALRGELEAGRLAGDALYVLYPREAPRLEAAWKDQARCRDLERWRVCVASN
jgi:hypothetical protein